MQKHEMMDKIIQYQMRLISTSQVSKFLDEYTEALSKPLVSNSLPDHYAGELNIKRIKAYKKLAKQYRVDESTVRACFCEGADWYKAQAEGNELLPAGKMTTTYTRLTTIKDKCWACMGNGYKWETTYHNQPIKCKCYICQGTGQREMVQSEDATIYVASLEIELKNLKALMASKEDDLKPRCFKCGSEMIIQHPFGWVCPNISCR